MIDQVLCEVSKVGISIDHGSANRAWIKAAYLFVEHYIYPVLSKEHQDKENFVKEVTINLLQSLLSHNQDHGCQKNDRNLDFGKKPKCLPIRNCFVSLKRLKDKHLKVPSHCHLNWTSYGKMVFSSCEYSSWSVLRSILIGILQPDETGNQILLKDKSGYLPVHCVDLKLDHLNTVSLLCCWNFISENNQEISYVEVLCQPVVLKSFKQCNNSNQNNLITCDNNLSNQFLGNKKSVSGFFQCVITHNEFIFLILSPKPSWEDSEVFHECSMSYYKHCNIVIHLQAPHLQQGWLCCLTFNNQVTVTCVQYADENETSSHFVTTSNSQLFVSSDKVEFLKHLERQDILFEMSTTYFPNTVCTMLIGKVFDVINAQLKIISLDVGGIVVFLTAIKCVYGLRKGALLLIQNFHLCKIDGKNAVVCCEYSSINILKHSNEPTMLINSNLTKELYLHPSCLFSLVPLFNYLSFHISSEQVSDLLNEEWFIKDVLCYSKKNTEINLQPAFQCNAQALLSLKPFVYAHLSTKMLSNAAVTKAKSYFKLNQVNIIWKSVCFEAKELFQHIFDYTWNENAIIIGEIKSSQTGCFMFLDKVSFLKCIVLPAKFGNKDYVIADKKINHLWKNFSPLCNKYVGFLVRLLNFYVIVERTAVSMNEVPSSNNSVFYDNSFKYLPYLVFRESDIIVLKQKQSFCHILKSDQETCTMSNQHKNNLATSLTKDVNSIRGLDATVYLLFLIYKGPLQRFNNGHNNFLINAWKYCQSSEFDECFFQFKDNAAHWFTYLYPTMLIEMEVYDTFKSESCISNCHVIDMDCCKLFHIKDFNDSNWFSFDEIEHFFSFAYKKWKTNRFASGIEKVFTIDEIFLSPPDLLQLVSVKGEIIKRIEWKSPLYEDAYDHHLQLTLATSSNCNVFLKIELHENCLYNLVGLIPGAVVTFFRVKCTLSHQGQLCCKYVPGSFHVVHDIINQSEPNKADFFAISKYRWVSSVPRSLLYNLYMKQASEDEHKVILIEAFQSRLLNLKMTIKQRYDGTIAPPTSIERSNPSNKPTVDEEKHIYSNHVVSFHAKSIVSDGSARAIIHFSNQTQVDFCKLASIGADEWNDVIELLRHSSSQAIEYDCDVDHDDTMMCFNQTMPDRQAHDIAIALFNDVNSRLLSPKKILMRRRKVYRKRPWKSISNIDKTILDGLEEEPMFRIGTVPVECHGNTSLRSLSLRLLQFDCLTIV